MLLNLLKLAFGKIIAIPHRRRLAAFEEATREPRVVQEAVLQGILARHRDTDFSRKHHFADVRTVADFRRQMPISNYDYFEPYITRVTRGETRALLADDKVHMFAMTSGTTNSKRLRDAAASSSSCMPRGRRAGAGGSPTLTVSGACVSSLMGSRGG